MNHAGKGPKGYTRDDEKIKDNVCETLTWNPDVDATEIHVEVAKGEVTLTGKVDSRHAKKAAERSIENVRGVVDVFNRLGIKDKLDIHSDKIIARGDDGFYTQEPGPR